MTNILEEKNFCNKVSINSQDGLTCAEPHKESQIGAQKQEEIFRRRTYQNGGGKRHARALSFRKRMKCTTGLPRNKQERF